MEEWRDINDYGGIYQVSNVGRVRSFLKKDGFVGYGISDTPKIMSIIKKDNGYRYVTLSKDKSTQNHYVHRLVAEAFIGEIPIGSVVNHIDENKANNDVSNLEIITQLENIRYSAHKMRKPRKSDDDRYICYRQSCDRYEVTVNRKYLGHYKTIEEARKVRDEYIEKINYY